MAEPRPRPPSPPRPAPRGLSRRSRPLQEASAGVHPSAQLGRAGETAAMRPLQLWRSAAAVRSTCRPAQSAATAVSGAARAARPGYRTAGQVRLSSASPPLVQSLFKDQRRAETPTTTGLTFLSSGVSVTLSNAVGGSTTGSLSLTQSATGGAGGGGSSALGGGSPTDGAGGDATSILSGSNPSGASAYSLTANATGGLGGGAGFGGNGPGGSATATVTAASSVGHGSVSAVTSATGGEAGLRRF